MYIFGKITIIDNILDIYQHVIHKYLIILFIIHSGLSIIIDKCLIINPSLVNTIKNKTMYFLFCNSNITTYLAYI